MGKNENLGPDFLGIGAQKAGTTWLYHQLKKHPDIYLPPVKDIHYFDRLTYPEYRSKHRQFHRMLKKFVRRGSDNPSWFLNYCFGKVDDDWYRSLFNSAKNRLAGEITPSYTTLRIREIRHVHRLNPNMKLILTMRDPIDRAWSHYRMVLRKERLVHSELSENDVMDILNRKVLAQKGNYARSLERWLRVFKRDQLLVGYFDQIKSDPTSLLTAIYSHLGVSHTTIKEETASEPQNVGHSLTIDQKYEGILRDKLRPQVSQLYDLLQDPMIKNWL